MNKQLKKTLATGMLLVFLLVNVGMPVAIFAEDAQPTPPAETTVTTESTPTQPSESTTQSTATAEPTPTEKPRRENDSSRRRAENEALEAAAAAANPSPTPVAVTTTTNGQPEGESSNGNGEAPEIKTGDATTNGAIFNDANSNLSTGGGAGAGGATVANTNNGAGSTNTGTASTVNSGDTTQINGATVNNDMNMGASTGNNEASRNFGGASIETGDADVSGSIINSVNTNVDGVAVAEFNVVDDHVGDIILDFSNSNCTVGCGGSGDTSVTNTGNGSNSTNTADASTATTNNTFQYNDADITNDMTLTALTGGNMANDNIGGDVDIKTGDANISANVANFVNNNIAGNVLLGVVNIFGDLVGDIILPENPFASCSSCFANNTSASNTGNGAGSTNTANVGTYDENNTFQYNDASIQNNLIIDANTGGNETSGNIGGDKSIETGDTTVNAQVLNIANTNLMGGDWWLVIVNEAGKWMGKIMGAPEGSNFAGSQGMEFLVDPVTGEVTASNNGNLAGSTNTANASTSNTNNTTQVNNANIVNNINLTGNTGDNQANRNGSGDVSVKTGDVDIVANLVNFVNNNISGNGRLFVTVVNVFGNWMGNLVTPGQSKQAQASNNSSNNNSGQSNNNNNNNGSSNSSSSTVASATGTKTVTTTGGGEVTINSKKFAGGTVEGTSTGGTKNEATVAKSVGQDGSAAVADKKVTINLAWLLLALPLMGIALMAKKSFVPVQRLALRGIHLFL